MLQCRLNVFKSDKFLSLLISRLNDRRERMTLLETWFLGSVKNSNLLTITTLLVNVIATIVVADDTFLLAELSTAQSTINTTGFMHIGI